MSTEPFVGEVKLFAFNFSVVSYDFCNGQLYPIAQNQALFALIGTTYGGDGQTTFALPDLRGRVPIGQGQGAGLAPTDMGDRAGHVDVTLVTANIPQHIHSVIGMEVLIQATNAIAEETSPGGTFPATTTAERYASAAQPGVTTGHAVVSGQTDQTGGGMSLDVRNPYLVMNFCIAIEGIFPSRN